MFITGFEKIARVNPSSLAYKATRALAWPVGKLRTIGKQTSKTVGKATENIAGGIKAGVKPTRFGEGGHIKKSPGGSLTEHRMTKATEGKTLTEREKNQLHSNTQSQTERQLHERGKRMQEYKEKLKRGPSFAMRHPFATAAGTIYAGKKLLEDKDQGGASGSEANNWVGGG